MSNGSNDIMPRVIAVASAPNYGRFAIGPLEAGIGITLGNALRRILLSSLPGSAVTSVRLQNVYHEFSCIPHVREDVTEIVLNIKNLRFRSYSERPVRLQLVKDGPGEVRAGDLELPANVELVNPELVLATLDDAEGRLELELTVERGRGYISFETREGLPIGTIPVDALFSPIPKVNYISEPADADVLTAAGEDGEEAPELDAAALEGREQLLMEIWTDGTIDPGEALSIAAQYLAQHSALISNFNRTVAAAPGRELPGTVAIPAHLFEMPIEDLNLSMRTYNCLKRSGVTKVGQVLRMDRKELLGLRNFGEKSFEELYQSLSSRDLIPPGTPLDIPSEEAIASGDDLDAGAEDETDVAYPDIDSELDRPEPSGYIEAQDGSSGGEGLQIVDAGGVGEDSVEMSAGIYVDDEPAAEKMDLVGEPVPDTGEVREESGVKPKARSKKTG